MKRSQECVKMSKELTQKDVKKACHTWWLSSHLTYNYQRLQAGAMAAMMGPILDKLYEGDKEEISSGLKRHMLYFNTEPRFGAVIPGMVVALEEGKANAEDGADETDIITELKTALMGPLAGIGDTISQGLVKQLLLSVSLGIAVEGNIAGALLWAIGFTAFDYVVTRVMFMKGYQLGIDSVDKVLDQNVINKLTTFLGIVGLSSLGVMICKFVPIQAITEFQVTSGTVNVNDLLDKICPCLLPLLFTLGAYKLNKKGVSITKILLILVAVSFVGGALGILG